MYATLGGDELTQMFIVSVCKSLSTVWAPKSFIHQETYEHKITQNLTNYMPQLKIWLHIVVKAGAINFDALHQLLYLSILKSSYCNSIENRFICGDRSSNELQRLGYMTGYQNSSPNNDRYAAWHDGPIRYLSEIESRNSINMYQQHSDLYC